MKSTFHLLITFIILALQSQITFSIPPSKLVESLRSEKGVTIITNEDEEVTLLLLKNLNNKLYGEIKDEKGKFEIDTNGTTGFIKTYNPTKLYKINVLHGEVIFTKVNYHNVSCNIPEHNHKHSHPEFKHKPIGITVQSNQLESYPQGTAVIYIDFDGFLIESNSIWSRNGEQTFCSPSTLTEAQKIYAWQIIAEDFRPFNINVTTIESVYNNTPSNNRQRLVVTPDKDWYHRPVGGIAAPVSFGTNTPCFDFNQHGPTGSHELGHTLGLSHDGRTQPREGYYAGNTYFAPIMGAGFHGFDIWCKGEYNNGNNFEDDLAKISSPLNGFGYRQDDHANNFTSATNLIDVNGNISSDNNFGVIETREDKDFFKFKGSGNPIHLEIKVPSTVNNLNPEVKLYNSSYNLIRTYSPTNSYDIIIEFNSNNEDYYLVVDGVGFGDPISNGYSDYGSLGYYSISGSLNNNNQLTFSPSITPITPINSQTFQLNKLQPINLQALAQDLDGDIIECSFILNNQIFNPNKHNGVYDLNWTPSFFGKQNLTIRAVNNDFIITSKSIKFNVNQKLDVDIEFFQPLKEVYYMNELIKVPIEFKANNYFPVIESASLEINGQHFSPSLKGGKYFLDWTPDSHGQHTIKASITDQNGVHISDNFEINIIKTCTDIIDRSNWSTLFFTSEETVSGQYPFENLFDGDTNTTWSTKWDMNENWPYEFQLDLGAQRKISGVKMQYYKDFAPNYHWYTPWDIKIYTSNSINDWGEPVFDDNVGSTQLKHELFFKETDARYIKLVIESVSNLPGAWSQISEFNVFGDCKDIIAEVSAELDNEKPKIYPNPASNSINIRELTTNPNDSWKIISIGGQEVLAGIGTEINITNLEAGAYLIQVINKSKVKSYSFIKSKH